MWRDDGRGGDSSGLDGSYAPGVLRHLVGWVIYV